MKLSQMRYICAVCKYGTISKAAEKLFISQPTLSVAIKDLEDEFDVVLLERDKRGVKLTEAGNIMVEQATRILNMVDSLAKQMHEISQNTREIRVGFSSAMSKQVVPLLIQHIDAFEEKHPNVKVHLMERVYNRQFDDLDKGITTMAFGKSAKPLPGGLAYTQLLESPLHLCVGPNHPLANRSSVCIGDFVQEEILTILNFDSKTNIAIMDWAKKMGYDINFQYYSQSSVVEELIRMGRGVALLVPKIYINNAEIKNIPIRNSVKLEYGMFFKKGRKLMEAEIDFIKLVRRVLNDT